MFDLLIESLLSVIWYHKSTSMKFSLKLGVIISREIEKQHEYPDIGVTELILSNGMKVCYKFTDFKNDQVLFCLL